MKPHCRSQRSKCPRLAPPPSALQETFAAYRASSGYGSEGKLVAVVTQTQKPDSSKFASARPELIRQLEGKKQRELYDDWLKKLTAKAKIDMNPDVVRNESES